MSFTTPILNATSLQTLVKDPGSAEAIAHLQNEIDTVSASVTTESLARATADEALAVNITTVQASLTSSIVAVQASVTTESLARATADEALAVNITTVQASLTSSIGVVSASVTSEATARATADTALATNITTVQASLTSSIGAVSASVTTESVARASADSALSSSITTLSSSVGSLSSTVTILSSAYIVGGVAIATWGFQLDGGGKVIGMQAIAASGGSQPSTGTIIFSGADLQTDNYAAGSSGWKISYTGDVEFNTVFVRTLNLAPGSITQYASGSSGGGTVGDGGENEVASAGINANGLPVMVSVIVTVTVTSTGSSGALSGAVNTYNDNGLICETPFTLPHVNGSSITLRIVVPDAPGSGTMGYAFNVKNNHTGGSVLSWGTSYILVTQPYQ